MKTRVCSVAALFLLFSLASGPAISADPGDQPLAAFEPLIGGEWTLGDGYQVLEWGVGKRSVIARSYHRGPDGPRLVSEGSWFFHPGKEAIVGYFTAVNMGIALFEYRTIAGKDGLESQIVTWDEQGRESRYVERWTLQGDDRYLWQLMTIGEGVLTPVSEGVFTRHGPAEAGMEAEKP
ncbi:MAG: hypothetical protein PVG91_11405 [Gammaproteobacteria bacterium]|jgi:hypothetical protein